jgi:hypothetical protein
MPVDVGEISASLRKFVRSHHGQFQGLSERKSQLLEIGALMIAAQHYELSGYDVDLHNPKGRDIRVKLGTRGDPWNFSYFEVRRGARRFEIHTNLPVEDAVGTEGARYVADVVVVPARKVPRKRPKGDEKWFALPNADLVTFIEAKSLVIYPMLIAQFIGIVHELMPEFLDGQRPAGFKAARHFDPALVSLGYLHGTCWNIVKGFPARGLHIRIVAEFDSAIANLRRGSTRSPLAQDSGIPIPSAKKTSKGVVRRPFALAGRARKGTG